MVNANSERNQNSSALNSVYHLAIGTLSIDNEIHDDDFCNPRRIGSRLSFSAGKTKVKQCSELFLGDDDFWFSDK